MEFAQALYQRNYICGAEGNLSIRVHGDRILITPAGLNKWFLSTHDLVVCNMEGNYKSGKKDPSSEIKLHTFIYERRSDIKAVCHAHPLYATSFAAAGIPLDRPVLPEIVGTLGIVPLAEYAAPGSDQLAQSISEYVERYDAVLLRSHGVVTMGASIEDAFNKMEAVEKFAGILIIAERLGGARCLRQDEAERLLRLAGRIDLKDALQYDRNQSD